MKFSRGVTLAYITQLALGPGIFKENQNQASKAQRWWGWLSLWVLGSFQASYKSPSG